MRETALERWRRYRTVVATEGLPCALVDLDAVEANVRTLARPLEGAGKTLRVATKSVRCPDLVRRILAVGGTTARGLMTYTAAETAFWAEEGHRDLLLAYPVARPLEASLVAEANAKGATASVVVDCPEHLELLSAAAREHATRIPVVLELDVGYRPLGSSVHIGVRRSPLREPSDVVALARRASSTEGLTFHGVMAYEAQIAGLGDKGAAVRAMKAASRKDVERARAEVARALREANMKAALFNGGGTGTVSSCAGEPDLTEVTAGSGFVDSHLFDGYRGLALEPAAFFALAVVRRPREGMVTCHGGGYVASGGAGPDRLPLPTLPPGLKLLSLEGAGEVQTPLELGPGVALSLGDPVFFRHAKAGELAEHFSEYLLVRGDHVEARVPTYRGLGRCFLG